ncbi:hypothetical protein OsI_32164 [Oryza sativa Indica Group]|uniref:Uncharacterized protein n=1 Tax=Oryza sativa subsp. indica TaxID=39946 RepID=B8BDV5_ORYSI|nr:hypothetical protein OsI_32164 [Oryza sativa Indica Group]
MQLEVFLTLPESDYNRRLGVFQMNLEHDRISGHKTKNEGHYSRLQNPVMGIRIILEQRAEFSPGAGIPEIYAASLKLEAELPLLKRILWNWRWTLFDFGDQTTVDIITLRATARKQPNHGPRLGDAKVAFRVRTNYHKHERQMVNNAFSSAYDIVNTLVTTSLCLISVVLSLASA